MNNLYFWKKWNSPYRQIYTFLLSVFILTLIALGYAAYTGMDHVVQWEVETELEPVKVVVDQFSRNLFTFTVESESFYALDKYVASEVRGNLFIAYVFLALIVVGVVFILTTFSYLDLYWFMGGMLAFLFFLFSLKIEMLELFGRMDRLPMVGIFLLYGGISYWFNAYYKSASYLFRLGIFSLLTVMTGGVIYQYSSVATPFLYLANFGSLFPVIILLLFMLVVGYDIIKGFLYVVSSSQTAGSKNSALNFLFASLLYLINVFLLLMKKLYIFELNIVYINPFLLLAVSAILGVWMFKKRSEMFSSVLPFAPAGAYVYLSLAIIVMAGAAYAFLNGNIGMIEIYERIIVYGHLFVGLVFVIYVMVNFVALFDKKISIYEIVYKPARMTFLAVPAIAIAISVFFFLYQKKYPYHLAMAGYYTYAGDVMAYEEQYPLAFQYYKKAVSFDYPNQRANYSIASLCASLGDKETAKGYYENALFRDPNVQSYIGLSNAYMETGELFKALFSVQEGIKKFPEEGRLYNNLAVLYHKSNLADSAIHYFLKSRQLLEEKQVASSNIVYLLMKKELVEEADSIIQSEDYPGSISFLNNKLALLNLLGKKADQPFDPSILKDTLLNANTYAYLVNANINSLKDTSSTELTVLIDSLSDVKANEAYKDKLKCQRALKKYYAGQRFEAMQDVLMLKAISPQEAEYSVLLGNWMLEQEQYEQAAGYYKNVLQLGVQDQVVNYAFASIMAGEKEEAFFVLSQMNERDPAGVYSTMRQLISIKEWKALASLDEIKKFQWLLYNMKSFAPEAVEPMVNSFTNPRIRLFSGAALCRYYILKNNLPKARETFAGIQNIQDLNPYAEGERNYTFLLLQTALKEGTVLTEKAGQLPLNPDKEMLRSFFKASGYALLNDTARALPLYIKTLSEAPYSEEVIPVTVAYLSKYGQQQEAYDYLVEIVRNNPSVRFEISYLELCMDMELISYAESTLGGLKGRISAQEFARYQNKLIAIQNH